MNTFWCSFTFESYMWFMHWHPCKFWEQPLGTILRNGCKLYAFQFTTLFPEPRHLNDGTPKLEMRSLVAGCLLILTPRAGLVFPQWPFKTNLLLLKPAPWPTLHEIGLLTATNHQKPLLNIRTQLLTLWVWHPRSMNCKVFNSYTSGILHGAVNFVSFTITYQKQF